MAKARKYRLDPDIQALPVSRQRKLHLQLRRLGLCKRCGGMLATRQYCLKHAIEARERQRIYQGSTRRNVSKTRRLEQEMSK